MTSDLVIRGGRIVTPQGIADADIAIEDEYIAAVAAELPASKHEIDASGSTVLPGAD